MKADKPILFVESQPQVSRRVLQDGCDSMTEAGGVIEDRDATMIEVIESATVRAYPKALVGTFHQPKDRIATQSVAHCVDADLAVLVNMIQAFAVGADP